MYIYIYIYITYIYAFFLSSPFISNTRLKLTKYQAKAKQHPKAEILLLENYSFSSSSKNSSVYFKKSTNQ